MKFSDLLEATLLLLLGLLLAYIVVKSDYFIIADIALGAYVVAFLIEFRHKLVSLR